MALANPALILVVWFACNSVFGALIPLATAFHVLFVAKHALEDQLVINRILNWVIFVNLSKIIVSVHLDLDACDDI